MPRTCDLQHIAVIQPLAVKVYDLQEAVSRLDCRNRPEAVSRERLLSTWLLLVDRIPTRQQEGIDLDNLAAGSVMGQRSLVASVRQHLAMPTRLTPDGLHKG